MTSIDPNLRKAAVLLRSLDADTAAMMLGQLSSEEAIAIRGAMRVLGTIESDEQADLAAELRSVQPVKKATPSGDVELSLSSAFDNDLPAYSQQSEVAAARTCRFEFLASAPTSALVPYLAREHAQTVAVVLSHLAPERAAAILAALPQKVQAAAIERLAELGETDAESVSVLERELEAWVAKREGARGGARRRDTMAAILAAADAKDRSSILNNMKNHTAAQASHLAMRKASANAAPKPSAHEYRVHATKIRRPLTNHLQREQPAERSAPRAAAPLPRVAFDDLINFDARSLAGVLRQVDPNVLALALAGSREEMVDRICEQMPKRTGREFRRELRRLGPTRLSDVEAAQQAVARIAARQIAEHKTSLSGAGL